MTKNRSVKTAFFKLLAYITVLFLLMFWFSPLIYSALKSMFNLKGETGNSLSLPVVIVESLTLFATVWLASWLVTRQLDRRPFGSLGLRLYPKAALEMGFGVLLGGLMLFVLWSVDSLWLWLIEGEAISASGIAVPWSQIPSVLVFMGFIALNEELLVRGYPLQVLIRHIGILPAIIGTSVAFGLLHVVGDVWNAALVVLDTGFGGALFALAYVKTRALWMPISLHFSNNIIIFLFENPDIESINLIPPEMSQSLFWNWWLINFPLYLVVLFVLWRWNYKPDPRMDAIYQRHVAPSAVSSSEIEIQTSENHAREHDI